MLLSAPAAQWHPQTNIALPKDVSQVSSGNQAGSTSPLLLQQIHGPADTPPSGFFLPHALFGGAPPPAREVAPASTDSVPESSLETAVEPASELAPVPAPEPVPEQSLQPSPVALTIVPASRLAVGIYISPTTRAYFAAGGVDYLQTIVEPWEALLRRQDFDAVRIDSADRLGSASLDVLILPSALALTQGERSALGDFRARGGSLLATWLNGVRDEQGRWVGYEFMQRVLDAGVLGATVEQTEETFLMPHGDNPVVHQLPAGLRIWLERIADWYPLRLAATHSAAEIMDWARTTVAGRSNSTFVFDERTEGMPSRSAVIGFPERLWMSTDTKMLDKLIVDTLTWLARRPDAYLGSWPHHYSGAVMLAVDVPDALEVEDLRFLDLAENLGGQATYFLISENIDKAAPEAIARLKDGRHEIAFHGDRFEAFKDEPRAKQISRVDGMLRELKSVGIKPDVTAGFHTPMDSYDATTLAVLAEKGFAYHLTDISMSEDRLPHPVNGKYADRLLLLPSTLLSPDILLDEGKSPEEALKQFTQAAELSRQMSGLTVIPIQQRSAFTNAQWQQALAPLFVGESKPWLASGREVTTWWRERSRVSTWLDNTVSPPLLTVEIGGEEALRQPVAVLVNLRSQAAQYRLVQDGADEKAFAPVLQSLDRWRLSLSLLGAAPGRYHWHLVPDTPSGNSSSSALRQPW